MDRPESISERLEREMCAAKMAADSANKHQSSGMLSGSQAQEACGELKSYDSRPSIRSRIRDMRHGAEMQSRKANRLGELEFLLDKNPEVARILDLIEEVGR